MTQSRKLSFVSFNGVDGPENSYFATPSVQDIEMRHDGLGPLGNYDVVYVTHKDGTLSMLPAHNCNEIIFAEKVEVKS